MKPVCTRSWGDTASPTCTSAACAPTSAWVGPRSLVTAIRASRYSSDCAGRTATGLQDNTGGGRIQGHWSGEGCCYSAGDQGEPRAGGQQQGGGVWWTLSNRMLCQSNPQVNLLVKGVDRRPELGYKLALECRKIIKYYPQKNKMYEIVWAKMSHQSLARACDSSMSQ